MFECSVVSLLCCRNFSFMEVGFQVFIAVSKIVSRYLVSFFGICVFCSMGFCRNDNDKCQFFRVQCFCVGI